MASKLPSGFPVCEIIEEGITTYLICVPNQGDHPFTYLCNILIIKKHLQIGNEDVGPIKMDGKDGETVQGISRETLLDKIIYSFLLKTYNYGDPEKKKKEFLSTFKMSQFPLEPTFKGVFDFKNLDTVGTKKHPYKHPYQYMTFQFDQAVYHGYAVEAGHDLNILIGENSLFKLQRDVKKKLRKPPLDENWTKIYEFLRRPSEYVLSKLKSCLGSEPSLFYWNRLFSTIKMHKGKLYVLNCSASSSLKQVVWQNFSVITDPGVENLFFDNNFNEIDQTRLEYLQKHCHDGEPESNDDAESSSRKTKTDLVKIIELYGEDNLLEEKVLSKVKDSIKRNIRVFGENLQQVSSQMPAILTDHLKVYIICGTSQSLEAVREIRSSILSLVTAFLEKAQVSAEVSQQVELEVIFPLMAEIHHELPPPELSMAIVKNCKDIYQIFKPVFHASDAQLEPHYYSYQFSLLAKISSCQFELLHTSPFPLERVLIGFSKALKENRISIDDNHVCILELLESFEKNIINFNDLVVMNDQMAIILDTIVPVYRHATISIPQQTLRSLKSGVFKFVEAFIENAQGFEDLETKIVIPLMHHEINCCMQQGPDQITPEFMSLSKMVMIKCCKISTIFETLFDKLTTRCDDHHDYFLVLLGEACIQGKITTLTQQQLNSAIEFTRWATKQSISKARAGVDLLIKILKAFEVPKFDHEFYRNNLLKIFEKDVFAVILDSPHPELESDVLELLKQLYDLVDKMSEPIWHEQQVPIHYNQLFVKEHVANFVSSKFSQIPYSKVTRFIDGVYAARNSKERTDKLLIELSEEISFITSSNETPEHESSRNPDLYSATCEKKFKEQFQVFFHKYTQDHCHSPHYKGVVCFMYITGQHELKIDFNHILSYDPLLANDLVNSYTRFEPLVKLIVSQYVSEMKNHLDALPKEQSEKTLYTQSLCDNKLKVVIDSMPSSMTNFAEFINRPGNQVLKNQTIFDNGPHKVELQSKTDLGLLALSSYIHEMCELHAAGYTFGGKFTLKDFKVFNNTVFKICAPKISTARKSEDDASTAGKSVDDVDVHEAESKDFFKFVDELLPCYADSAFIPQLAEKMRNYVTKSSYSPEAARMFRMGLMTHLAGKNSVVKVC